jgi:prepilin-type N-terminal cleavage/methylation domain-containing protein
MKKHFSNSRMKRGFTLVELMMAVGILTLVVAGSMTTYVLHRKGWESASLKYTTANKASRVMEEMVFGMSRSGGAGYQTYSLRGVEADTIIFRTWPDGSWRLWYNDTGGFRTKLHYSMLDQTIRNRRVVIAKNVADSSAVLRDGGIEIHVEIEGSKGPITIASEMTTFVDFRN